MTELKQPDDHFSFREEKILMSYAKLLRVISLFPEGLADLSTAHSDPVVLTTVPQILLATKGAEAEDYPPVESYELTLKEGEDLSEWGLAHAFDFFARRMESAVKTATSTGERIKKVSEAAEALAKSTSSLTGSKT